MKITILNPFTRKLQYYPADFKTGDLKFSFNITQPGWVPCLGLTIGKTGSGADYMGEEYHALYDFFDGLFGGGDWDGLVTYTLPDATNRFVLSVDPALLVMTGLSGSMTTNLTSTNQLPHLGGDPEPSYLKSPITVTNQTVNTTGLTNVVKSFTTGSFKGAGADIDVMNANIMAVLLIKL